MAAAVTLTTRLADEAATASLMADLGLLVGGDDTITLSGDLGAGKTAAARALIRYFAGDETLDVPSPTFTLVQRYDLAPVSILHADLYRIDRVSDLDELDLIPPPAGALVLIEWPERAAHFLPRNRIDVRLSADSDDTSARLVTITGFGNSTVKVARLEALRAFIERSGLSGAERLRMSGDASSRSYARLRHNGQSLVLMNSPPRTDGPPVHNGRSYSAIVHLAEDIRPFVAMAEGLHAQHLSAPEILHVDLDHGFLVSEDFGSAGIVEGDPPEPIAERYQASVDMLARLHSTALPIGLPLPDGRSYRIPDFDMDAMLIEVGLMPEWYLPDRGVSVSAPMRAEFDALWRRLLGDAIDARKTWMLRDFHSPNVIWLASRTDIARVGIIDFQDAVLGPEAYDVVSLAQDARIDIPETLEIALVARYVKMRRTHGGDFDPARFAALYALMSAQRNTRLLGTFARLNRRDGKPHYLRHQPRAWMYLQRALAHPLLVRLRDWYAMYLPPPEG